MRGQSRAQQGAAFGHLYAFQCKGCQPHGFQTGLRPHLLDRIVRPAAPRGFNSSSSFPPLRWRTSTKHAGLNLWLVFPNSNPALPVITKARQSPRASAALVQQPGQRLNVLCKFVAQQNSQCLYVECEAGNWDGKEEEGMGLWNPERGPGNKDISENSVK